MTRLHYAGYVWDGSGLRPASESAWEIPGGGVREVLHQPITLNGENMAYTRVSSTARPIYAAPLGAVGEQFKGWLTAGAIIGAAIFVMKYVGPGRRKK